MSLVHRRWRAPVAAILLAATAPIAAAQSAQQALPRSAESQSREQWQRFADIVTALAIDSGSRVADVGAGNGYYTERLARRVGQQGRVFAVDVDEQAIERLEQLVAAQSLRNVELVLGKPDDPRLPYRSLDAALIVNAYHEMVRHSEMLREIHAALKPGGRLVILDNTPRDKNNPRYRQVEGHEIDIDLVAAELRDAGFEVVSRDDQFVNWNHNGNIHRNWLLVARRPEGVRSVRRI
ncbi:MAG: class I SAM-dependent methyltransferase [Gemmatimonadaceae bacterium]